MRRDDSFIGRFLLLCGSNLLLQGLGFLYRILLSRYAGAEGLGVYRLASSIYTILHATCLSGVTMACTRFSAARKEEGTVGAIGYLIRFAFSIFITLFALVSAVTWFGRDDICGVLVGDARVIAAIPFMLACLLLTGVENVFKSTMIGLNRIDHAVVSELTEQVVRMLAAAILLAECSNEDLGRTAVLIFCASVLSEIVSASIMTLMYLSMLRPNRTTPPSGYRSAVLHTVAPVSASALCGNFIASAGAVALPKCLVRSGLSNSASISALGALSGVAAPIITLPMALILSLCTVAMPEVSARCSRNSPEQLRAFTEKVLRSAGLIGIPFTALLIPLSPVISRLFFYQAIEPGIFWLMGLSCVLSYFQMVTGCLLNGSGRQFFHAVTGTGGELVQLGLVCLLSAQPGLRIYGYILAQCIAPLLVTACNLVLLTRFRIIPPHILRILPEPFVCGALLFFWTRIFFMVYAGLFSQWAALLLTLATALLFYLVLLRMLDVDIRRFLFSHRHTSAFYPMFY